KFAKSFMDLGGDGLVHSIIDEKVEAGFIALMKRRQAPYITTAALFESLADIPGFVRRQAAFDLSGLLTPDRVARLTDTRFVGSLRVTLGDKPVADPATFHGRLRANLRALYEAGVLVVSGTDTPFPGLQP